MLITIIETTRTDEPNKNGKGTYGVLNVAYRADGKISEKKLVSFSNPSVFKHIEGLSKGDTVNVKTEKQGDYWQWTGIEAESALSLDDVEALSESAKSITTGSATRVTGSTYETPAERALKQKYIVRQSSLTTAIDLLSKSTTPKLTKDAVITLAEELEAWVFRADAPLSVGKQDGGLSDDFEDDIPV